MTRKRGTGLDFVDALPEDGERRLMLAVLIDAVRIATVPAGEAASLQLSGKILRERLWFRSDDRSSPFSFLPICDSLGLNPDYIRRCVLSRTTEAPSIRVRRYAAKAEEAWGRQRRGGGAIWLHERVRNRAARKRTAGASHPVGKATQA